MRILFVATKSPLPPIDGGRLAMLLTLEALQRAGHEICVLAPTPATADRAARAVMVEELTSFGRLTLISVARRSNPALLYRWLLERKAFTLLRHESDAMKQAVANCVRGFKPDVVHVEQLQALANVESAGAVSLPVVLRMQNVESDLWQQVAESALHRRALAWDASRLRRAENAALRRCAAVLAIAASDADMLNAQANSPERRVAHLSPPFPSRLPAATALAGEPALVLSGSAGWWPNHSGATWFIKKIWPHVYGAIPAARLHVFGGTANCVPGAQVRSAPVESIHAFPEGAICIVPLHVASGLRMRILEAWARGLPVIATRCATQGLAIKDGQELIVADDADEFVAAIRRLQTEGAFRSALIDNGRAYLARYHDEAETCAALASAYQRAIAAGCGIQRSRTP